MASDVRGAIRSSRSDKAPHRGHCRRCLGLVLVYLGGLYERPVVRKMGHVVVCATATWVAVTLLLKLFSIYRR